MTTFYGTVGHDIRVGTSGSDRFDLYGGNDTALGEAGTDTIYGGEGDDRLRGGLRQDDRLPQAGAGYVVDNTDCNDGSVTVKPGATETCNGVDDDCEGGTDEGLAALICGAGACAPSVPACIAGVPQACAPCGDAGADANLDASGDGVSSEVGGDGRDGGDGGDARGDAPDGGDAARADARDASTADGAIVAPRPTEKDEGCGCRVGGAHRDRGGVLGVLGIGFLLLLARRRRQGRAR